MKFIYTFILVFLLVNLLGAQPVKLWEVNDIYKAPESTAYDSKRDCLYISNYTKNIKNGEAYGEHTISKADINGKVIQYDWIKNLTTPTGICVHDDKLYIVERFGVVEYDLASDKISNKYLIRTSSFLNDITVAPDTSIYVSESNTNIIYKIKNSNVEIWMQGEEISKPNGILYDDGKIIVGVNSDDCLKEINISNKSVRKIAHLGPGIIDGVKKCAGGYLVSHFLGNLYFVSLSGEVKELLNTREDKVNIADFEYVEDKGVIIVPALNNNKLMGYKYEHRP